MSGKKISDLRKNYGKKHLSLENAPSSPIVLFEEWFSEALDAHINEPNAMILATLGADNVLSQRTVLLKDLDNGHFEFHTNYKSRKAVDIESNNRVSLLFLWLELERQVRIEGAATKVSRQKSENYFNSRPRESCLGAWASRQSAVLQSAEELYERYKFYENKYKNQAVPCPDFWGGYAVNPYSMEFWQGGANRLHHRLVYTLENEHWTMKQLFP